MAMQDYHEIWLKAHPERSREWLLERLADGFHIHHVDGNKDNNDPANLVLIEGADHMKLHGCDLGKMRTTASNRKKKDRKRFKAPSGKGMAELMRRAEAIYRADMERERMATQTRELLSGL